MPAPLCRALMLSALILLASARSHCAPWPADSDKKSAAIVAPFKDSLRNAYELAKALSSFEIDTNRLLDNDAIKRYQILLGRVMWYANLQDSSGNVLSMLMKKLRRGYPALNEKIVRMFQQLYPIDAFFTTSKEIAYEKISSKRNNNLGATLKKFKGEYLELNNALAASLQQLDTLTIKKNMLHSSVDSIGNIMYSTGFNDSVALVALEARMADTLKHIQELGQKIADTRAQTTDTIKNELDALSGILTDINPSERKNLINSPPYYEMGHASIKAAEAHEAANVTYTTQIMAPQAMSYHMPSQTEMIDALGIYVAKRVKQESVMWFFETVSKNAADYELLRVFFPSTLKLLTGNEVYEIPNMGAQWKYALSEDFMRLPQNVMKSQWLKDRWPAGKDYATFISGACEVADGLMNQKTYPDIIRSLYIENTTNTVVRRDTTVTFRDLINLLYGINNELFIVSDDSAHTSRLLRYEDYRNMNRNELELMLSLVDMKYGKPFHKLLAGMSPQLQFNASVGPEHVRQMLGKVESAVSSMEAVRKDFVTEQKKDESTDAAPQRIAYTTYNLWNATNNLFSIFNTSSPTGTIYSQALMKSQEAFYYTGRLFDVYNLISKKNYAGAVQQTLVVLDSIFFGFRPDSLYKINLKNVEGFTGMYGSSRLLTSIIDNVHCGPQCHELIRMKKEFDFSIVGDSILCFKKTSPIAAVVFERDRHAVQLIKRLAAFLNDAALAKNSGELAQAVESYALPPGSYKRKRNSWWSADVNAFAGPYYGQEWLANGAAFTEDRSSVYGLSVPIGFSLSKTLGHATRPGKAMRADYILNPNKVKLLKNHVYYRTKSTFTLTLSIIDIGAVVSYRLGHNDSALPQAVKWEQFISPGLHLGYGLGGTPLVLQTGLQYTPLLRRFASNGETDKQYNAYRVYLGLFYDLPLVNMWEKKRIAYRRREQ